LRAADAALVRRAAWSVALQTAAAVALVVLVVSVSSVLVFDRQQAAEIRDLAQRAATTADDVDDPPAGIWLVRIGLDAAGRPTGRTAGVGTPPEAAAASVLDTAPAGLLQVDADGRTWTAWVDVRPDVRFVAIYDQGLHVAEEQRLIVAVTVAGLLGIVLAALLGWVVARRAVRPLGAALTLQRQFVADASHELRTPLAVVHTRAQVLRRRAAPDDPSRPELDQLVADTRVLGDVVADLLTSAQLEHTAPVGEEVHVAELARLVAASMTVVAATRDVRLVVDDPAGGVEEAHADVVLGARTALRRALSALVDNAIAHSPAGSTVRLEVARRGSDVLVSVLDDGEGLDPQDTARLTQRFARGSDTGAGRRFGLGLALVDEVVRAHGGRLEIAGRIGEGSRFTLVLPAAALPRVADGEVTGAADDLL
jgi:signal transduction histidine kinase